MKRVLMTSSAWLLSALLTMHAIGCARTLGAEARSVRFVEEWEQIPPADAPLPKLSKSELLVHLAQQAEAWGRLASWDVQYRNVWRFAGGVVGEDRHVHLIRSGNHWLCEYRVKYPAREPAGVDAKEKVEAPTNRITSDGTFAYCIEPARKTASISKLRAEGDEGGGIPATGPQTPIGFLPILDAGGISYSFWRDGLAFSRHVLPDIREFAADPETKLLPWQSRVNGVACYVLERLTVEKRPIFKNAEEAAAWRRKHNRPAVVNPYAEAGAVITSKRRLRVAIAPEHGFTPIRWARGTVSENPGYTITPGNYEMPAISLEMFPDAEILCSGIRSLGGGLFIPEKITYSRYTSQGQDKALRDQSEVILQDFQINAPCASDVFSCNIPEGYLVADLSREIAYTAGDTPEIISRLVKGAEARRVYYERLKREKSPPLQGTAWINSKGIKPEDMRGKRVILYFWSAGCGPCLRELPRLQEAYGQPRSGEGPLFLSVHPYVDGEDLERVRKVVRQHGVTFPVMIDLPDRKSTSWGQTFRHYGVEGVPREVALDSNGRFLETQGEMISSRSRWVSNPDDDELPSEANPSHGVTSPPSTRQ